MKRAMRCTVLAMAALIALPAVAQQTRVYREGNAWVEETSGTLAAAPTLRVVTVTGNVSVQGGPVDRFMYQVRKRAFTGSEQRARQQFGELNVSARTTGDTAIIQAIGASHNHRGSVEFIVQAPRSTQYAKLETHGGNISVAALDGRAELASGGGNLRVDDIGGTVKASSGGGNVDVGTVRSDVSVATGGGNVRIGTVGGAVKTSTGGGNIQVMSSAQNVAVSTGGGAIDIKKCGGELKATTGGGSLDLGAIAGAAKISTGGGSIRLLNATGPVTATTGGGSIELFGLSQGARVETGGGSIVAEFLPGNFTGSTLETPAGDIVVYLSPQLRATVKAVIEMADGHRIRSELNDIRVRSEGGEYGPRTAFAEGTLNGGGPTLSVRTTSGDIEFRRAKK